MTVATAMPAVKANARAATNIFVMHIHGHRYPNDYAEYPDVVPKGEYLLEFSRGGDLNASLTQPHGK
jgi:hypothetical protein